MWRLNPNIEPHMNQREEDGITCLSWLKPKTIFHTQVKPGSLACWSQYWKHFEGWEPQFHPVGYEQVHKSVRSSGLGGISADFPVTMSSVELNYG